MAHEIPVFTEGKAGCLTCFNIPHVSYVTAISQMLTLSNWVQKCLDWRHPPPRQAKQAEKQEWGVRVWPRTGCWALYRPEWVALQDSPWQHWLAKWYLWSSNRWTVKATSVLFLVQFDSEQNLFWYTCRNPPAARQAQTVSTRRSFGESSVLGRQCFRQGQTT